MQTWWWVYKSISISDLPAYSTTTWFTIRLWWWWGYKDGNGLDLVHMKLIALSDICQKQTEQIICKSPKSLRKKGFHRNKHSVYIYTLYISYISMTLYLEHIWWTPETNLNWLKVNIKQIEPFVQSAWPPCPPTHSTQFPSCSSRWTWPLSALVLM